MKLTARQLRKIDAINVPARSPLYIIASDIVDTYNVGGLFRLADALSASHLYLCGVTEKPPNNKIKTSSCGTFNVVPWTHVPTALDAVKDLREKISNIEIVAIEQTANSVPFQRMKYEYPLAILVGNESVGIPLEVLMVVDKIVEIPMLGVNSSLNVVVAASLVGFQAMIGEK